MPGLRSICSAALCLLLVAGTEVGIAGADVGVADVAPSHPVGARGAGDPYFPAQGNGGYDVRHYRLELHYWPHGQKLRGVATIFARATQPLSRFDLDLRHSLKASTVHVNGSPATARQPKKLTQELQITPRHTIAKGHKFIVVVHYAGVGKPVHDPDGSLDGWIPTKDGAFVASEPQGSPTWFPVNDSPHDKASYRVAVSAPKRLKVIGNGTLKHRTTHGSRTTWTWRIDHPISSYLVTATVGKFIIRRGHTGNGVPYFIAVDPTQRAALAGLVRKVPAIVSFFTKRFGRYPFGSTGAIVDNAPFVGYALETATRPLFDQKPDELTVAHELAHQWFGDAVTLKRWRDIWLNEGFAEFSSWVWDGHRGGQTAATHLREWLRAGTDVRPPPANPGGAKDVFAGSVYDRGAAALQALREKIGSGTFFKILRGWVRAHRYHNATVPQFIAYAQTVTHRNLHPFVRVWLYNQRKPTLG